MQISATVIAAQQAAREARAALSQPAAPKPAVSFLASFDKESAEPAPSKTAAGATSAEPQVFRRPGSLVDIII